MDDTLSIGDTVCLYSAERFGFIFSTQSSSVHNEVAVGSQQDRQRPDVQDQQVISFHLEVANRYKLNKQLRKLQAKLAKDKDNISLRNTVSRAKLAAEEENEDNILEQKRQQGKKVLYGQIIQLRHLFTNKYIHVSTTKTSDTETNNMAVELKEENSKHALFRLMPRYKVKAEGDVVQVDDQVVLESVKSPYSYLHVSKSFLGQLSVYSKSHELNVSVQQSGFTIYRKYKPTAGDSTKIKFGDLIRFYHKEMEAYLVASGLFDDELLEDVHMRLRPMDQTIPKTLFPSSSAITYWQIERQEGPVSGGVLKWEQQCKIIHMCTRKYLTVKDGHVTLTSDHLNPTTVFRLHPVIRENDDIIPDSYCRIEHVVTGRWLHGGTEEYKKRQKDGDDSTQSMSSLKWSTAELKEIDTIEEMQYDDAFTIQKVDEEFVSIFNYMAGMVPFIQKLIADKKAGLKLNAKMAHDAECALQEVSAFMVVKGYPIKRRQKLLRNLRIVELLVRLLEIPFRGTADQIHMTKLFVEAYHVMYVYLMGDSRKNELYIAKYIDFFQSQFEIRENQIGLNAVHMVLELIRDNRKIVDRISNEHIDKFVDLLQRDKNHRYLDLLGVLCVCDGVSIAVNQKYITEAWLMRDSKSCVYYTDLGQKIEKESGVVYVSTTQRRTWTELSNFANCKLNESYLFLEHQLELFGYLCHGQNEFSIKVITQELNYLTWEEAFTCLSDTRLPDKLRSQYCDLIITMFVDIGDNHSVVDRVKLSYKYDDIDSVEGSRLIKHTDRVDNAQFKTYKYFPTLSEWISNFLMSNGDMTASTIGNNLLIKQVLRLVDYLVSFGFYYKPEDIKRLLEPLMSLTDGRNDKPYPNVTGKDADDVLKAFRAKERFERSEETSAIVEAKCQALDTLDLFFNYIFNLRMERFMSMFKVTYTQANNPNSAPPELGPLLSENFDLHSQHSVCKCALKKLRDIFEQTSFLKNYEVVDILKVLYHARDTNINQRAEGPRADIGRGLIQDVMWKRDLSFYHYDEMIRMSMHLLNRYFSSHHQLFKNTVQAQVLITDKSEAVMETLETLLPSLRRLSSAKLDNQQAEELVAMLNKLISMCHLEKESEEAHGMNQSILYNHGLIEDMFIILQQDIDVCFLDQYTGQKKVLQRAFTLLKLMARDNKLVQGRLFDRLDMLLSKRGAESELAECITEVFTGNSNTCMKIHSYQVHKIMTLVSIHKKNVPQFLDLLNAVVKVEELDLPLKRNQSFVMQYFMQYRSDIAQVIDQEEGSRLQILTNTGGPELQYLISMVDVLATCAEGENRHIESICQTIFSIRDLLKILTNQMISNNFKLPFLRFLLWVYLNTAGGMIESGAGDMPHDSLMWQYLSEITTDLDKVTKCAKDDTEKTKMLLKSPPPRSNTKGNKDEETQGTLHYIFDGIMPFLQIFCRSFYQPDSSVFPEEPAKIDELANSFKECMEVVAPLICVERQMKRLVSCMTSLFSASTLPVKIMEEFNEKYGQTMGSHDIRSDARKSYESYYEMEEEINRQLNVFSVNMRVAYGGPNTIEAQIDYNSNAVYSEVGGDEELPLGQEFQDHLKCFMDLGTKDPIERYQMSEKLIRQLKISNQLTHLSEEEKVEQEQLDVKCLQLLRAMIYNEVVKLPDDWEADISAHRKKLKAISDVQDALNHFDVVSSVMIHLNRPQDDVVRETLSFICMLLYNGNENVQTKLYEYFTGTREESFFFTLKARMQMSAIATREKRLLHAMYQSKVDEAVQQAKALQKAMASGKMAQLEILKANRIGSMMSMAERSMAQFHPGSSMLALPRASTPPSRFGSKAKLGGGFSRENTMMGNLLLQSPTLNVNDVQKSTLQINGIPNGFSNPKSKVAPMEDTPEIQIEKVDDEELKELMGAAMSMTGEFTFRDDGYIELVLRMLGLMCDNQHFELQNYIREQYDNIKSVNLVAETTKFLNVLYSNINKRTMPLVVQLFDTLVKFTSGNKKNQSVVFENKVCDYINHILRTGHFPGCGLEEEYILKRSIAVLIRSLTEENSSDEDEEIMAKSVINTEIRRHELSTTQEVMESLDEDHCVNTMTEAYSQIMGMNKSPSSKNDRREFGELYDLIESTGFAYFHILCREMDMYPSLGRDNLLKTDIQRAAWDYYAASSLSIEIVKDDALQKVYFRVKDKNVLREEIKEKFKYEVDRTSPSNKIRDFMDWASDIIQDIKYQRKIHSNIVGRILLKMWLPMNYIVLLLSFIISSVIMVTWRDPKNANGTSNTGSIVPEFTINSNTYYMFLYIFGGIHNFLSLCMLVTFLISNQPTFPPYNWLKKKLSSNDDDDDDVRSWHEKKDQSHLKFEIYNIYTIYYFLFFVCSILGTIYYGYFFSFHLLHLAELNQLLKRVRMAVTTNGKALLMVALLGLALFFCYSLVAFAVLRESFFKELNGRHCRTVYQCFITMIHHGFVDTPYTTFEDLMTSEYTEVIMVTVFDVTFFILITTIGLNIIFGIIVDTFSELRDAKWAIDKDMMNKCFICSRESYDFERHGGGFEKHVKTEHHQWSYLFFFIHLTEIRPNDFSTLELFVYNQLERHNYDFFPLNRALSLQNKEDSNERKVEILCIQVDYIVNKMKEEAAEKERQKEKQRQLAWEAEHKAPATNTVTRKSKQR